MRMNWDKYKMLSRDSQNEKNCSIIYFCIIDILIAEH